MTIVRCKNNVYDTIFLTDDDEGVNSDSGKESEAEKGSADLPSKFCCMLFVCCYLSRLLVFT